MTPRDFFEQVAAKNAWRVSQSPDDIRLCVNAIISLDVFLGILHAHLFATGATPILLESEWKDTALARQSDEYRLLRDYSYALKRGNLTGHAAYRLVLKPDQITEHNGPTFETPLVWIEADGQSPQRADVTIAKVILLAQEQLKANNLI